MNDKHASNVERHYDDTNAFLLRTASHQPDVSDYLCCRPGVQWSLLTAADCFDGVMIKIQYVIVSYGRQGLRELLKKHK